MKSRFLSALSVFSLLAGLLLAGPRDAQWRTVDEAVAQRLPKTALATLEPIIAGALADHRHAEAVRAIARKAALESELAGDKPEAAIARLQTEVARAPAAMKPMMEALLAHWYWNYFNQNRWKFAQRTQAGAASGDDLATWDLARIVTEIDRHFTAALADENALRQIPIADFDDVLDQGTVPDAYRPTLYDFLVFQALAFYQAGEQGAAHAEDAFELESDSPIFAPVAEFLRWSPPTTDTASPKLKAIRLYQAVLRFHASDRDRSAFLDADLDRLVFGFNAATGETKTERYVSALEEIARRAPDHEIFARAKALLAQQAREAGHPAQAREIARHGVAAFPASTGGVICRNLIQEIEAKAASLSTEFVWNAPWPTLDVAYRNVTKVYFRAVPVDFAARLVRTNLWQATQFAPDETSALLAAAPALAWSADLPATTDFRERTEKLPAPTTLKPGFYAIVASFTPDFSTAHNRLSVAPVWVSDLALVLETNYVGKPVRGFVLDARSGDPVPGATIRTWSPNRKGVLADGERLTTDALGRFQLDASRQQMVLLASNGRHSVSTRQPVFGNEFDSAERTRPTTLFFTDRALYRPGQTVSYKGICFRADTKGSRYATLARERVEVVFNDPNGKEIARATHVTNDYGSFAGVFTAPRDRLMGNMTLQVVAGPAGQTFVGVEEYKRPKFEVQIAAPAEAAKLGHPVEIAGTASAYSGAAIGGATVKWRVERHVQLPPWCWWWRPPETQAIAHGVATTQPDGTFKLQFTAAPDRSVPEKNEPVFHYSIHADVTDTTGETRSADRSIAAAYTALQATLHVDEWQTPATPVTFAVATTSLDGTPQAATGTVTIHELRQPATVARAPLAAPLRWWADRTNAPAVDPTNSASWENGNEVARLSFQTDSKSETKGATNVAAALPAGIYRASLETKDRFGKAVTARTEFQVVDPSASKYGVHLPSFFAAPKWTREPGEKFSAVWGTGYDSGRAFVEIECANQILQRYWTRADRTQSTIELPVTEDMRGGVSVRVMTVHDNRLTLHERQIDVPWTNKALAVKWESFRSKLQPGQTETWTATITGPDGKPATAEMAAALYDASLDQFRPHQWPSTFNAFRREFGTVQRALQNQLVGFNAFEDEWNLVPHPFEWRYRTFLDELAVPDETIVLSAFAVSEDGAVGYAARPSLAGSRVRTKLKDVASSISIVTNQFLADAAPVDGTVLTYSPSDDEHAANGASPLIRDLNVVSARTNLTETAFFFPQLLSEADGTVKLQFTMPEGLTKWKFLGFAHDRELRSGLLTGEAVTSKDLMVEPNAPRFVREGDAIEFTVKVSNQTDHPQSGKVRLNFADAATLASADAAVGNQANEQKFEVPAKQSRTYAWRIQIPDGLGYLTYKAVGATTGASDGEEGFLPVLSRRILVTESLPLPIRGATTKEFNFDKLLASGKSDTLKHQSLTVQMVSQPAWYAVMSLPYLMEFPHECSEQLFSRLYANALARHIANSDPKIRRIFDLWRGTPTLDSPLSKNQDLKAVMLEETPWLRQANRESEARRNVGLLFDANRLDSETSRVLQQLAERQMPDGLWSWFPGGRGDDYITLVIVTGFGRLRHLGVAIDTAPAVKALAALDAAMEHEYREIQRLPHPEDYVPSARDALYLYGRSLFKDEPVAAEHREAFDFFLQHARQFWTKMGNRQTEAHLALALERFDQHDTAAAIAASLKERSASTEELGMFWNENTGGWWWYQAPIETQAMMIEVFAEITHDDRAVEDCKVWLLKQKQTQDWRTTRATADAVYALLLRGTDLLASDALVEVSLGGTPITPEKVEAGTGYYEQKFVRDEIKPAQGAIRVRKTDAGVSWGSVHWQYLEDMAKVSPHEGTPLKLKKALFVKENTKQGPVLKPVSGPLAVGDELVVRLELRTDRDMEYVHLKDQRGSGTEPVNVLSTYRWQDGLGYYESTRDTASHFYIDHLAKGTYVFEYSTRVQLKGRYQSGIAEIQCMYAPEFNSHSESQVLEVK